MKKTTYFLLLALLAMQKAYASDEGKDVFLNLIQTNENKLKTAKDLSVSSDEKERLLNLPIIKSTSSDTNSNFLKSILIKNTFCVESDTLETCIKNTQKYLGLNEDGIAGGLMYTNLAVTNIELSSYVETLKNLMGNSPNDRAIIVNIPTFKLVAWKGSAFVESKVIVGKPERKTPTDQINVISLKTNPTWTPPKGIMEKDILPNLGTSKLDHKKLIIEDEEGNRLTTRDLSREDFESGSFKIWQPSGDSNALGVFKFETNSKDSIYLHDTNDRKLFDREYRALSSGCVRVQSWRELAGLISNKSVGDIDALVANKETRFHKIPQSVPVVFLYSLVWPSASERGFSLGMDPYSHFIAGKEVWRQPSQALAQTAKKKISKTSVRNQEGSLFEGDGKRF